MVPDSTMDFGLLCSVRRPARYLGSELHAVSSPRKDDLRVGLAFPDHYEIGMSHLGLSILYGCLNQSRGIFAERVFLPDADMERALRTRGMPLTTLETRTPLRHLDLIGFSLAYELTYTNVLGILDLGGIPLHAEERARLDPLVVAGGPCAFNPEPLSPFVDAFVIGEAEYLLPELCLLVKEWKASGTSKEELLRSLDRMEGVYVPALFSWDHRPDRGGWTLSPLTGRKDPIRKRIVEDLDSAPFPDRPLVPFAKIVHDRISVEAARGCPHGCRFCQASVLYRPCRERSPGRILDLAAKALETTGYEELSLLALSIGDYSCLVPLVREFMAHAEAKRVALSLPSLRVGSLEPEVIRQIRKVRKTGFTMAPEAATTRLRNAINKEIDEEELLRSARLLAGLGWRSLKLYFMIGLPHEAEEDVEEIVSLAKRIRRQALQAGPGPFQVTVNVSTFVPKAHTPFQWHPQLPSEEAETRQRLLQRRLKKPDFRLKWHDPRVSLLEGLFARGDRRTAVVLEEAYRLGCTRDAWTEHFRPDLWEKAFEKTGTSPQEILHRFPDPEAPLPWEWIDPGVSRQFLLREYKKAAQAEPTPFRCLGRCDLCNLCKDSGERAVEASGRHAQRPDASAATALTGPQPFTPRGQPLVRVRLHYAKQRPAICLGHLETLTAFHRALRRSNLPLAFTQGEHPHLRTAFSPALPLGMESLAEFIEVWLLTAVLPDAVRDALNSQLPRGFRILAAETIPLEAPSLEESIAWMDYEVHFSGEGPPRPCRDGLERCIKTFQTDGSAVVEVKSEGKRTFLDLRPAVREIRVIDGPGLFLRIQRIHGSIPSPTRILEALLPPEEWDHAVTSLRKVQTDFLDILSPSSSMKRVSGHGK